ncbi:conserved hypothetical protein [Uncinocarpus reesii 1704]|uniref:RNB domain-containing protein n=1 Tax=Uncinocarpus reesii (strain UAMH 1704) TaxID=336963 RepID=C4JTU8_UNCRE|nr:uncharacterized protein UREG_05887 [Uncinocarpus reesii 1704]EEP81045.1 conserved hypothetical protein [Uncinocarpus reesii 1704]
MDQQGQSGVPGPAGRRLHIAHRRSPSELTPLMMEQLALQQQIELLQQQQQQIAATQQYVNMGYIQPQQPLQHMPAAYSPTMQGQAGIPNMPSHGNAFQFPQVQQQQLGVSMNNPNQPSHRRNQSAIPNVNMGPPPAPSSGSAYSEYNQQNQNQGNHNRENGGQGQGRGRGTPGGGHQRRHSLALPEARKAAELAQQKRTTSGFQFPIPGSSGTSSTGQGETATPEEKTTHATINTTPQAPHGLGVQRAGNIRAGTHMRSQSLAIGNGRGPAPRGMAGFQFPQTGDNTGDGQRRAITGANKATKASHRTSREDQLGVSTNNKQQQQRKTLFTPYLPQANLPALLNDGQLVTGILRVNKKNRSDAYVTTPDLDADIFICGSKDRNRALEGDLVAIELLDVDEVWSQKREKEEKKKRKDITDTRSGSSAGLERGRSESATNGESQVAPDGSIRRRGSLRQRPTQKKNDDVEVEGQSLLLVEEDEISDDHKPLYAGHVVAVIERVPGQMFSGSLGLLRPSSQATKEKQEAERQARDGGHSRPQQERHQDKPKIVWFKPTDKRVPLIAIPTEQAPRDFVEKHQDYANNIFVAAIKRWPITSLHPFGTLVEQLGSMGDLNVETDALLRDNNFASDEFSDAVLKNVGFENWTVESESAASLAARRDFRDEKIFTIDPNGSNELDNAIHLKQLSDGKVEIGFHVADVTHFIKPNSLVDREAKKRGTGVYLMTRIVNMLPPRLSSNICCLQPGEDRFTISVVYHIDPKTGIVEGEPWIGKGIIKSSGKLTYDEVDAVLSDKDVELHAATIADIKLLNCIATKFREARFGHRSADVPPLRLFYQLDDENVPVFHNIFDSSSAHELMEELSHKTNSLVAKRLFTVLPQKALLRRQASPNYRRLGTFVDRMTRLGYEMDSSSSGSLQTSLFKVQDVDLRKLSQGMETLLVKAMRRAKYYTAGSVRDDDRQHYALNLPLYTHFTNPSRRYADIVVHRQLDAIINNVEFSEDIESLTKIADHCNNKKDSAQNAQEQSVHIESCRIIDKKRQEIGGDLVSEGIVLCVYESAFDVLIPEFGFEKRVHCDQLPLKKAEFRKDERVLELYWEKGVPSSAYIPEDERPKPTLSSRAANAAAAARQAEEARQRAREREEAQRKQTETGTMSTDDVDALFDDDDDDSMSELAEMTAGVSLNSPADRSTQSMPPSPTRNGRVQTPHRTQSDPKIATSAAETPEGKLTNKEKYLKLFKLREENGEYIQDVTEMTRVPIILKTDLTKSPPVPYMRSPFRRLAPSFLAAHSPTSFYPVTS